MSDAELADRLTPFLGQTVAPGSSGAIKLNSCSWPLWDSWTDTSFAWVVCHVSQNYGNPKSISLQLMAS